VRGRRRLLLALGALGALCAIVLVRRPPSGAAPRPAAPAAPAAVPTAASAPPTASRATAPAPAAADRPRPTLAPGGIARAAAEDYRRRAKYPRWSYPLAAAEDDPIVRERVVHPVRSRGPRGEEPALTVYPALVGFEAPEPAVVHAFLTLGDRRVEARSVRATVVTDRLEPVAELEYRDDGTGGDAQAGDRIYTATFAPGPESSGRLSVSYMVRVQATSLGDEQRIAVTSFLYSYPDAQLTGAFRDTVVDGSLHVQAEIAVTAAGRFHLEATLYDAGGTQALAWAQAAHELAPGRHWLTLPFYGLILRERGVDGPYLLRHVALSTVSDMPNAKNRVADAAHVTAAYRAAAFTDAPYNDAALMDAAERVEGDTAGLGPLEAGG
jgi:hypothetical protein